MSKSRQRIIPYKLNASVNIQNAINKYNVFYRQINKVIKIVTQFYDEIKISFKMSNTLLLLTLYFIFFKHGRLNVQKNYELIDHYTVLFEITVLNT